MMKKQMIYMGMGLLLCLSATLYGCKEKEELPGSINGSITDKTTGEPIMSAGVELLPSGQKSVTGSDGEYLFSVVDPGTYKLHITKTGYTDFLSNEITVKSEQTTRCVMQIEKLPPALRIVNDNEEDIDELDLGAEDDDVMCSFNLFNDGTQPLLWQITTEADWIMEVSTEYGTLAPGALQTIMIKIDRKNLNEGDNVTTVDITSNDGNCQLKIKAKGCLFVALESLNLMVQKYDMPLGEYKWEDAKVACEQLTIGGYTDWRLPTVSELAELCERRSEIAVDFTNDVYWTSDRDEDAIIETNYLDIYKLVNFRQGEDCYQGWGRDYSKLLVRAVRTITK